jgi:hypothetical protein
MSVLQVSRPSADELGLSRRLRQALALPLLALALLLVLVGVLGALLCWPGWSQYAHKPRLGIMTALAGED